MDSKPHVMPTPPDHTLSARRGGIDPTVAVCLWILATLLAAPLVIGLTEVMPFMLIRRNGFEGAWELPAYGLFGAISGALAGGLVGGSQWLLLRAWVPGAFGWIGATILGWALGGGMALALVGPDLPLTTVPVSRLFLAGVACGVAIGVCQWLFLRRRIPSAGLWPITTVLGWVVGLLLAGIVWPQEPLQMGFLAIPAFVLLVLPNLAIFPGLCLLLYRRLSNRLL